MAHGNSRDSDRKQERRSELSNEENQSVGARLLTMTFSENSYNIRVERQSTGSTWSRRKYILYEVVHAACGAGAGAGRTRYEYEYENCTRSREKNEW